MILTPLDWGLIALYFALSLGIGLRYMRRASPSLEQYFVSGRGLPWWLAGTSMVATTFAADTPLAVTGLVAHHGIAGNWLWWNMALSGLLTAFLFARLWRRAGVLTDVEFAEIRYGGRPAAFLRAFRALYLALPVNLLIMGWVTLAMVKILSLTLGTEEWEATFLCLGVAGLYAILSGIWGVVVTDFLQFIVAMAGSILLAFFALRAVGGTEGLLAGLAERFGPDAPALLAFFPPAGSSWMPPLTLAVYLAVNWWATWYPGAEPGGGGYIAQRLLAARDERHSFLSALWFNAAHYALRPWPWILTALASLLLYPGLADPESGYVRVMVDHLPAGFRGFLLAAFAAAYMSTISTHLNWGSSYLVSDVYRRFLARGRPERHYVAASRIATVVLLVAAGIVSSRLATVEGAWKVLLAIGAGTGLVYLLRWYWWRVNAWSEVAAMGASLVTSLSLQAWGWSPDDPRAFPRLILGTMGVTTAVWLAVTFLTPPESPDVLRRFYERVRPAGPLWGPVARACRTTIPAGEGLGFLLGCWALACATLYAALFSIGKLLLRDWTPGLVLLGMAAAGGLVLDRLLRRRGSPTSLPSPAPPRDPLSRTPPPR